MAQQTSVNKKLSTTTETHQTSLSADESSHFEGSKPDPTIHESILQKDRKLREHLSSLSLSSIDEYVAWCEKNGFSTAVDKNWKQRCKESYYASKTKIEVRRKSLKQDKRRPDKAISAAFSNSSGTADEKSAWVKRIRDIASAADEQTQDAFRRIIERLHATKSPLLKSAKTFELNGGKLFLIPALQYPEFETQRNSSIEALASVSLYESRWVRPIETWKPSSKNFTKQFASLVRHLFAKYPTPAFLDCVWFEGESLTKQERHEWFIKLAGGSSVRKLSLPIPLTKKMAHHFQRTPTGLGIMSAIRRSQVLACGGNDQLLTGLLATRIATSTEHNAFWLSVIQWLVDHPMLHPWQFGPIVDYFHHRKFDLAPDGETETSFLPNTMTPDRVIQGMHRWHAGLRKLTISKDEEWAAHPSINPFQFVESPFVTWQIEQLLSVRQLQIEGQQLRHCVLSYAKQCKANKTTIWSLSVRRKRMKRNRKVLTIEVSPTSGRIIQIRGRGNRNGRRNEIDVIRRWAASESLHLL